MSSLSTLSTNNGIAILTLSSPDGLNLLTDSLVEHIEELLAEVGKDDAVHCLIVTGDKNVFSAGADLKALTTLTPGAARKFVERGQRLCTQLESLPFPSIAVLNGHALGGGCELALSCTFRFASDNATIGLPEVKLGIMPGFGGTQRLPRLIGFHAARRLLLSGVAIEAQPALDLGLVDVVTAREHLLMRSIEYATAIASKPRSSVFGILRALYARRDMSMDDALRLEVDLFVELFQQPSRTELITGFLTGQRL